MRYLNSKPIQDYPHFTPRQKEICASTEFQYVGDILAILPSRVDEILPFRGTIAPSVKYRQIMTIQAVTHRKSQRGLGYILLRVSYGSEYLQGFLFSRARFIIHKLKVGESFIMDFSLFKEGGLSKNVIIHKVNPIPIKFDLGSLDHRILEMVYPKMNASVDNRFLKTLHARIRPEDYRADLRGLTPDELELPFLDLYGLHHPSGFEEYLQISQRFLLLKVYLKTALQSYVTHLSTDKKVAIAPRLDLDWLRTATKLLPVTLTPTQKAAIWEVLKDTTIGWENSL